MGYDRASRSKHENRSKPLNNRAPRHPVIFLRNRILSENGAEVIEGARD